jgi:hypothetical protein
MKPRLVTGASAPESRPALSPARQKLEGLIEQRTGHERNDRHPQQACGHS